MPFLRFFLVFALFFPIQAQQQTTQQPAASIILWGGLFWLGSSDYNAETDASEIPLAIEQTLAEDPQTKHALIGHHIAELPQEWFTWINFSEEFFLRVERSGETESGELALDVQFWQQDQLLLSTNIVLTEQRPLLIQGPAWKDGHLLATLAILPAEEHPAE